MPSFDNLPADQRAVLQMVVSRGRSYEEIAGLLSINPAAVRERAQIALDTIGPHSDEPPEHQHRIADYLLGQLSDADAEGVRELLADSPGDRAWARVVSSELVPLAGDTPLPEIPVERPAPREPEAPSPAAPPADGPASVAPEAEPPVAGPAAGPAAPPAGAKRSSRLGGALLIILGVVAVAAILFFVLRGGDSKKHVAPTPTTISTAPASASTTASTSSATASTSGTSANVLAQINLSPPSGAKPSKAVGIAEVLNEGDADGIAIVAQKVPPNATKPPNAYAVWLYNSQKDSKLLGFVNPGVGTTGRLSTAGPLPTNAAHYKELIVSVETTASPKEPGPIILQGALTHL
jgi:sigma-70-like protein